MKHIIVYPRAVNIITQLDGDQTLCIGPKNDSASFTDNIACVTQCSDVVSGGGAINHWDVETKGIQFFR